MAFCGNCGSEVADAAIMCPSCGAAVGSGSAPAAAVAGGRTEGMAVASLVLGIVSVVPCWGFVCFGLVGFITSILAIVFAKQARDRMAADPTLQGEGMAKAGNIMGWIGVGFAVLGLLLVLLGVAGGLAEFPQPY